MVLSTETSSTSSLGPRFCLDSSWTTRTESLRRTSSKDLSVLPRLENRPLEANPGSRSRKRVPIGTWRSGWNPR
ncbi:hypothetical protein L596_015752 [Steinernema carpocapsae]|uniref:Uncharacterized protein n=1 Tax=Steinernema carpocapsae TaxID=34508 RepID=A0A4U5NH00_STECR|nr:hypothetical protein L596_015752 [Steinernema carpocapsae]